MTAWRQAVELAIGEKDLAALGAIARSRTELWTTRLLARHAREQGPAEGHSSLAKLGQGTLCNILNGQEINKALQGALLPGTT
jgi:hypothetical protein